jgi:phosphorylcholine metabolism protein LicD
MNKLKLTYYSIYSLILIFFIIYFIVVFRDNDYKIGLRNFIKTHTSNKCYDIKITDENVIQKLYVIMKNFDEVCRFKNIPYFACAGTILGAIRHKKIIPWDDDLDVTVEVNDMDRLTNEVFPILFDKGFSIIRGTLTHNYRLVITGTVYPYMDIFFFRKVGKNLVSKSMYYGLMYPKEKNLPLSMIYPLKRYKLGAIEINGPNKGIDYLKKIYSPKVMDEVAGTFFDHNTFEYYRLCKKKLKDIDPKYL